MGEEWRDGVLEYWIDGENWEWNMDEQDGEEWRDGMRE